MKERYEASLKNLRYILFGLNISTYTLHASSTLVYNCTFPWKISSCLCIIPTTVFFHRKFPAPIQSCSTTLQTQYYHSYVRVRASYSQLAQLSASLSIIHTLHSHQCLYIDSFSRSSKNRSEHPAQMCPNFFEHSLYTCKGSLAARNWANLRLTRFIL